MRSAAEATSFNPRPPLLAGDAHPSDAVRRALRVSIRARHCWRAMRARVGPCPVGSRLQSAPAIAGGRCPGRPGERHAAHGFNPRPPLLAGDATAAMTSFAQDDVSIRARHCWRAMRCRWAGSPWLSAFQSAPAIAGGRCLLGEFFDPLRHRFNPRPPLLAGDAAGAIGLGTNHAVSIRARHCWRAMRDGGHGVRSGFCFNPRPPLLAGDAGPAVAAGVLKRVSIRARHCWRAMRRLPR